MEISSASNTVSLTALANDQPTKFHFPQRPLGINETAYVVRVINRIEYVILQEQKKHLILPTHYVVIVLSSSPKPQGVNGQVFTDINRKKKGNNNNNNR